MDKTQVNQCIGVSRGGRSTKIHTVVDALGNPIEVIVEKNTFAVDAISGATCTSNAVIAGAIEAWMQIMTERMSREEWMETANAEPMTGGWKNIPH